MKKRRRYSRVLAFALIFFAGEAGAQGVFTWKAAVDPVPRDGFYRILLTPEVIAKCSSADLRDLRILGPDKRFVSYVLKDAQSDSGLLPLRGAILAQKDSSNKHSYIELGFPESYEIDRLAFTVRDPVFYRRDAMVFAEGTRAGDWMYIHRCSLAPGSTSFSIRPVKTRRLRVDIANEDNAPLEIPEVAGFQAPRFLLSYLKAGTDYALLAGDAQAAAPEYDLKYFTDSLKAMPPTLVPGPVKRASVADKGTGTVVTKLKPGAGFGGVLLWGILVVLLILLTYFSVRMVKTITQKEENDRI